MSSAPPVGVPPPPPPFTYNVSSLTVEQYFGYSPSLGLAWTAAGLFLAVAVCIAVQVCFPSHAGGRAPTLTRSLSLSLTLSHTLTRSHAHTLTRSHAHTLTHSPSSSSFNGIGIPVTFGSS